MSDPKSDNKWQKIAEQADPEIEQSSASDEEVKKEEGQLEYPSRQELEDQLTALELRINEYKQQTARAQAELENYRRRAERDVKEAHQYGVSQLINALLPVVDGLVRGLESGNPEDPKIKPIFDGMQMTLDLLLKALSKFGVEVIDPAVGEEFNPKIHEAMGMEKSPEAKPNTIIRTLQKGYQLHGRVMRAAMVMVAA